MLKFIWKWTFRILKAAIVLVGGRAVVAVINLFGFFPGQAIADLVYSMVGIPQPGTIEAFQWSLAAIMGLSAWWLIHWYMGRGPYQINVELTPSTGPSPDIRLSIKNLGDAANFSATCRTVALRNDVNELRTGVFNFQWKSTKNKWATISRNEHRELLIARFHLRQEIEFGQIEFGQFDILEWSESGPQDFTGARWNIGGVNESLPEFDIEISIFQAGIDEPIIAKFTLRPAGQSGPLELIPLSAKNKNARKDEDQDTGPVYWTLAQTLSWIGFGKPITREQWTEDFIKDDLLIRPEDEIRKFNEAEQEFFERLRGEELTALGKKNDSHLHEEIPATYFLSDIECNILHDQINGSTSSLDTMLNWHGPKWEDVRIKRKDVLRLWPNHDGASDGTR